MPPYIAPSILAADFAHLGDAIEMLNQSEADRIHVDVMDGIFVPNISFGFPILKALREHTSLMLDVHLMIVDPDRYMNRFKENGANGLIVHWEACKHLNKTINDIKSLGMKAGVAINPHTPVDFLKDIIKDVDQVLVMSVNPGFGGQKFIDHTYSKVQELKELIKRSDASALIGVDGGVDLDNAERLIKSGGNILVAGSAVFKSDHPAKTISQLKMASNKKIGDKIINNLK